MPSRSRHINRRSLRGVVLPAVLWIAILAITVGVGYASTVHLGTRSTDNIKTSMMLRYDAISGVYLALDQLLAEPVSEVTRLRTHFNGSELDIEIRPENSKTDINNASADEIRAALIDSGIAADAARILAARIVDWRDPDKNALAMGMEDAQYHAENRGYGAKDSYIEDLSELLLIADIGRQAFVRLSDHFTVYRVGSRRIYSITSTSSRGGNSQLFVTRATVQVTGQGKPYKVLKWVHRHG